MTRGPTKSQDAKELYLSGTKVSDIARILGVSESTIRSWKSRQNWDDKCNEKCNAVATENATEIKNCQKQQKPEEISEVCENSELTDKQILFCVAYIRCFNATKAYMKAYGCEYNTAAVNGCKMLRNTKIQNYIKKLKQDRMNRELISEEDIIQKYIDIAFADMTEYAEWRTEEVQIYDPFGNPVMVPDEKGNKQPLKKTINVVYFKKSSVVDGTIVNEINLKNSTIKLGDRMKALQWLADHLDKGTDEQKQGIANLQSLINQFKERNEGDTNESDTIAQI